MLLIRSTLAAMWIKENGTPPPILFSELLPVAKSQPLALLPIHKIVMLKKEARPDKAIKRIPELDQFISDNRRACSIYAKVLVSKEEQSLILAENLFREIMLRLSNRESDFEQLISGID